MTFIKEKFQNIKGLLFDVDGVLSCDVSGLDENGDPVRTSNVKDGFAIRYALQNGFQIGIITGSNIERVKLRYQKIGVTHIYINSFNKTERLEDFLKKTGLQKEETLFMGDDLVDYEVMKEVGVPVCPSDAVPEIKAISHYIAEKEGGKGCVREVIEQVMRSQKKWFSQKIEGLKAD